jgi:hypothetical protein
MANITYLFGAGASIGALPVVNQMAKSIGLFIKEIEKPEYALRGEFYSDREPKMSKHMNLVSFIKDLKWLQDACNKHASVDTFAKKLYLKQDWINLRRLKATLSAYFILEQARKYNEEKRYDAFFASILEDRIHPLPGHIKILSWNYDYQFEQAYSGYSGNASLAANQSSLNVVSKHTSPGWFGSDFGIYKINGTTSIDQSESDERDHLNNQIPNNFNTSVIEIALRDYYFVINHSHSTTSTLSFAWEKDNQTKITELIKVATKDTDILVVVGYSFPFFNRSIDRQIIGNMINLKKVYFQAPDADNLKERFLAIKPAMESHKLVSRFNLDQFLLPDEL